MNMKTLWFQVKLTPWNHLVQVGLPVAAQRHRVQVRLRVFDGLADDAGLGGGASWVRGQFHLDLLHLVMGQLLTLVAPPPSLIG